MLRLDRGILRIGCDGSKGITRSSRVMTKRGERRGITAGREKMSGNGKKRRKVE